MRRTKRPAERSSAGADSADVRSLLLLRFLAVASGTLLERADAPADALHQFGNLAASEEQQYDQSDDDDLTRAQATEDTKAASVENAKLKGFL